MVCGKFHFAYKIADAKRSHLEENDLMKKVAVVKECVINKSTILLCCQSISMNVFIIISVETAYILIKQEAPRRCYHIFTRCMIPTDEEMFFPAHLT